MYVAPAGFRIRDNVQFDFADSVPVDINGVLNPPRTSSQYSGQEIATASKEQSNSTVRAPYRDGEDGGGEGHAPPGEGPSDGGGGENSGASNVGSGDGDEDEIQFEKVDGVAQLEELLEQEGSRDAFEDFDITS